MSRENHAYYLHHLGLPHWCERKPSLAEPIKKVLPADAKFLFIININVIDLIQFENYLFNVVGAMGCDMEHVAYVIYESSKKYNLNELNSYINNKEIRVLLLGDSSLQKAYESALEHNQTGVHLTLDSLYCWQSVEGKKDIMNWLLLNDFI